MLPGFPGWDEAAELVLRAFKTTVSEGRVTGDLAAQMPGVKPLSCPESGKAAIDNIRQYQKIRFFITSGRAGSVTAFILTA